MPRLSLKPIPKTRFHGSRWRIYWKWKGKSYSIPTNYLDQKKTAAVDSDQRLISAALAMDEPNFPEPYAEVPAVLQYMMDRYGHNTQSEVPTDPDWIAAYKSTLFSQSSKVWATHSMRYLNHLNEFCKKGKQHNSDIRMTTSAQAQEYLNSFILAGKSPGTRNRCLAACNSFFKWAIRTHRTRRNPFEGIKILPEQDAEDIVYCTKTEREEIIEMAIASGWQDWLAIPIAFYAGLRREEICRLKWSDIFFSKGNLVVRKGKTGKRTVPLSKELINFLSEIPESEQYGYVVKMPNDTGDESKDEITRPNRLTDMKMHLRREKENQLMEKWQIVKPTLYTREPRTLTGEQWKRVKNEYRKAKKRYCNERTKKGELLKAELERIGWNPFRHTFATMRVQAGVSLDKVSSWMGNTPDVCRKHYAQFVPRDHRDEDIDR